MKIGELETETDLDFNSPIDAAIQCAAWRYEEQLKDIRSRAESLIRTLQDVLEHCDRGLQGEAFSINSCGVIQSAGPGLDRECAGLAQRNEELRTLLALRRQAAEAGR